MNKRLITILQYIFFFGLGLFLAWWSVKDINREEKTQIENSIRHAKYWLIVPVIFILMGSHLVRSLRWRLLINSLGYHTKVSNTFFAVMIGYLTNLALPRFGEIAKCTFLARYEKVPADKLIGTIILERMIDAICLLIVFGITLAIQPDLYTELINAFFHSGTAKPDEKKISGLLIAAILFFVIAVGLITWMVVKKKKPYDVILLVKSIIRRVWQGISTIQHLRKRGLFIFYTLLMWTLYLAGGYIGFHALQETSIYGVKEAFSVLSAGSVGMIATPGGIGAYALLIEKTMVVYKLNESIATAFGWLLWAAQTAIVIFGGFFSFIAIPFFNKKNNNGEKTGIHTTENSHTA